MIATLCGTADTDVNTTLEFLKHARAQGRAPVVFVSGVFNVVHPGHLRLLRFAREQGSVLVVGVFCDRLVPKALLAEPDRLEGVRVLSYVDHAFLMTEPVSDVVRKIRPDLVIKGSEWAHADNPEEAIVREYGGRVLFSSGEITLSSLDLLHSEFRRRERFSPIPDTEFLTRRGITGRTLRDAIAAFPELRVLVLGDTIVDEYFFCDALGMSQEDPVLVVRPHTTERYIGGAAIVALHARGLGAQVRFASVLGNDEAGTWVEQEIARQGIETVLVRDDSRPTTLKQRYVSQGKKLLRVSHLREHAMGHDLIAAFTRRLDHLLEGVDLVLFSDFNYGFLCDEFRTEALRRCHERELLTAADSQSSSQIGDIGCYEGVGLVTPTEREARLALHDRESGLVVLAQRLQQRMHVRHMILTLAKDGVLIHEPNAAGSAEFATDSIPALNPNPKDTLGAGDAFLVGTSLTLAAGCSVWTAAYLGSLCAAFEVACVGNRPLAGPEIVAMLDPAIES